MTEPSSEFSANPDELSAILDDVMAAAFAGYLSDERRMPDGLVGELCPDENDGVTTMVFGNWHAKTIIFINRGQDGVGSDFAESNHSDEESWVVNRIVLRDILNMPMKIPIQDELKEVDYVEIEIYDDGRLKLAYMKEAKHDDENDDTIIELQRTEDGYDAEVIRYIKSHLGTDFWLAAFTESFNGSMDIFAQTCADGISNE